MKDKFKRIIARFWKSKEPNFDELDMHYELLGMPSTGDDETDRLIAKREKAKRQKKAWRPIQAEIEKRRTNVLGGRA